MVEAVLLDSNRILPACAYLTGQYGIQDVYCGVPVSLGAKGVTAIHEIKLEEASLNDLQSSASDVKDLCEKVASM